MHDGGASAVLDLVRARARTLGFDAFGVAAADARPDLPERLRTALDAGWHAGMDWMADTAERRGAPQALWPDVRSIILLGMNYGPDTDPMTRLADHGLANVSAYAQRRDYHEVIKGKLKELAGLLARRAGADVKVFVDTAPVMEKPLAEAAGLGWQGKHSVLVSRDFGSWLFLGAIFTDAVLPVSAPQRDLCGSCRRCLDACPTDAFAGPYRLDASKCLAYYSIEHEGPIPLAYRAAMGNRVFGCDDCLAVCPWNKFAAVAREIRLAERGDIAGLRLAEALALTEPDFRTVFAGTPVKRLGWSRFLRNALICAGNAHDAALLPAVVALLSHADPVVRGSAVWAARRLAGSSERAALQARFAAGETEPQVQQEWEAA